MQHQNLFSISGSSLNDKNRKNILKFSFNKHILIFIEK